MLDDTPQPGFDLVSAGHLIRAIKKVRCGQRNERDMEILEFASWLKIAYLLETSDAFSFIQLSSQKLHFTPKSTVSSFEHCPKHPELPLQTLVQGLADSGCVSIQPVSKRPEDAVVAGEIVRLQ